MTGGEFLNDVIVFTLDLDFPQLSLSLIHYYCNQVNKKISLTSLLLLFIN